MVVPNYHLSILINCCIGAMVNLTSGVLLIQPSTAAGNDMPSGFQAATLVHRERCPCIQAVGREYKRTQVKPN